MPRFGSWVAGVLLVLAGVLAAWGCGGGEEQSAEPAGTTTSCEPVSAPLEGTWAMMISPGELQELLLYLPEGSPETLRSGRFEMMLGPAHEQSVTAPNGDEFSSGSACVAGDRIQFLDETPAGGACSGFGEGVYRWEVVADRVIFDKVNDTCIWREVLTVGQAWMKVPS